MTSQTYSYDAVLIEIIFTENYQPSQYFTTAVHSFLRISWSSNCYEIQNMTPRYITIMRIFVVNFNKDIHWYLAVFSLYAPPIQSNYSHTSAGTNKSLSTVSERSVSLPVKSPWKGRCDVTVTLLCVQRNRTINDSRYNADTRHRPSRCVRTVNHACFLVSVVHPIEFFLSIRQLIICFFEKHYFKHILMHFTLNTSNACKTRQDLTEKID